MHSPLCSYLSIALVLLCLTAAAQPDGIFTTPAEQGAYQGNRRIGPWQYFDRPGTIALTVDYDNNKIFFERDTSDFFISRNEKWVRTKLQTPCRFHGSTVDLIEHYLRSTAVPVELWKRKLDLNPILTFVVNEEGIATSPEVLGDSLGELEKSILEAFESAPNRWIVGVTEQGEAVKCKMAISFLFHHNNVSAPKKPLDATLVINVTRHMGKVRSGGISTDFKTLSFSPDDSKIAVRVLESMRSVLSVIDLKTTRTEILPYGSIIGSTWLDENRVLFNYIYKAWPVYPAVYHTDLKTISDRTDSTIISTIVSSRRQQLLFTTNHDNSSFIWSTDLTFREKELITREDGAFLLAKEWSPDGHKILCLLAGSFNKWILIDLETDERVSIPLYDSQFLGWAADGRSIFLEKKERIDRYDLQTEVFRYDIEETSLRSIFKRKNVYDMSYHAGTDKLVSRYLSGKAYLSTMANPEEETFMFNNALRVQFSNDGNLIAFTNSKTLQLHVYDLTKKIAYQVSTWDVKK
jgi:WD40 repeat protein